MVFAGAIGIGAVLGSVHGAEIPDADTGGFLDCSCLGFDVDGTQFPAGQEIGGSQLLAAFQHKIRIHGHDTAGNDTVLMGIGQVDGILLKDVGDMIGLRSAAVSYPLEASG